MLENTGKPNKNRFQRGARMTPGEKRKYEAAMERWKKKQEDKPAKAAGGRVVAKRAPKSAARKKTLARTSVKKKSPRRP